MTTLSDPEYAAVADAVRRQDRRLALDLAARAAAKGHQHPLILVLAAEHLEARGKLDGAINLLRAATAAEPRKKAPWIRLGALLARQASWTAAAHAFESALAVAPDDLAALMGAGESRLMLYDNEAAERHYSRVVELEPRAAQAWAVLAAMAALQRDAPRARELARRAIALDPANAGAEMAFARADLLEGQPEAAEDRMSRLLLRTDLPEDQRAGALDLRATARDALGRWAGAFADYQGRNTIQARRYASQFGGDRPDRPASVARAFAEFVAETPREAWIAPDDPDPRPDQPRSHVFLMGYPRSGTTLMEKSLAGAPDVLVLEEINRLAEAGIGLRENRAAWERLAALNAEDAGKARELYWRRVREDLGDLSGKVLIDKLPLHTQHMPLIAKLFPRAKILFALRDPRDVVLSCFRRRFGVNAAMYELLTLNGAAEFYDAVMSLAASARERIRFDVLTVHHEKLIDEYDVRMREILEFVGAGWSESVRDFSGRLGRFDRNPSYAQLSRGLNTEGVGQWRRYETQMAPALPLLERWVRQYGYNL